MFFINIIFYFIICCKLGTIYCEESKYSYLKEKVKFIIFDDFDIGSDGKSIIDILNIEYNIPKENTYFLKDNIFIHEEDTLLVPILFRYIKESNSDFDWFFILNSNTRFDPYFLSNLLYKFNNEQNTYEKIRYIDNNNGIKSPKNDFIGVQINDDIPSIVHHYNLNKSFKYPFFHSGYAIRKFVIESLKVSINHNYSDSPNVYRSKIYTDVTYELTKLIKDEINISLKDVPEFCITLNDTNPQYHKKNSIVPVKCATWSISNRISYNCISFALPTYLNLENVVNPDEVVIAVKTTKKYHTIRINQINQLWANRKFLNYDFLNLNPSCINYYSFKKKFTDIFKEKYINLDILSDYGEQINNLNVIDLGSGNQSNGHCEKFYFIIKFLYNKYHNNLGKYKIKYFVFVDDDTLIVPSSLLNSLAYVNQYYDNEYLYMGLRYSLGSIIENWSIDYITGGAGIILNYNSLIKLAECKECVCNTPNEPDDMALGRWFKYLNIKTTNFFGFHQAEPDNYHSYYKYYSPIISYHKIGFNIYDTATKYNIKFFNLMYPYIKMNDDQKESNKNYHEEL